MAKTLKIFSVVIAVLLVLSLLMNIFLLYEHSSEKKAPAVPSGVRFTNMGAENLSIADSVRLANLFNPSILGEGNIGYSISYVSMAPGSNIPLRSLKSNDLQYYISGTGKVIIDGVEYTVHSGDSLFIPMGSKEKTINEGNETFEFLTIVEPAWTPAAETRYG